MPQKHQTTLTPDLTTLVTAVLEQGTGPLPRLAYLTDKGPAQDAYGRLLRKMKNPRQPSQRRTGEWVLDFFHVCSYVSQRSDARFGQLTQKGREWLGRMRRWLRDRKQGVAQLLRSALQHDNGGKLSKEATAAFGKAYRYLRGPSRWMAYERYRRQGLPLGSGVTEAACTTVFTQRLKRSGMRWSKAFGQVIVDLRVLQWSGIWDEVVRKDWEARPQVEHLPGTSYQPRTPAIRTKAA